MKSILRFLVIIALFFIMIIQKNALGKDTVISGFSNLSFSQQDTALVRSLVKKAIGLLGKSMLNPDSASAYIDSALTICKIQRIDIPAYLHLAHADLYSIRGDYSKSEEEAKKARDQAAADGEYMLMARAYLFLGRYNLKTGFFQESMDNFDKAIDLARQKGLKEISTRSLEGEADLLNTVGDLQGYRKKLQALIEEGYAEKDTLYVKLGLLKLGTLMGDKIRDFHLADSLLRQLFYNLIAKSG